MVSSLFNHIGILSFLVTETLAFVRQQCVATSDSYTTHGLLLLSKLELQSKAYHDYYTEVVQVTRGYLSAQVYF